MSDSNLDILNILEILNNQLLSVGRLDNAFSYQTDGENHFIKYGPLIILYEQEPLYKLYPSEDTLIDTILESTINQLNLNIQDLQSLTS